MLGDVVPRQSRARGVERRVVKDEFLRTRAEGRHRGGPQQQHRPRVGQHEPQAFCRIARIEREVGAAGREHRHVATISSLDFGIATATSESGPTPCAMSLRASRLIRVFSSA
ncbi:hypothetical protein ACFY1B_17355 [Streptomyces mirabilis]|uniref:hypothetical protein n=1 Tax=Streptomyces mirabilis TaxID=68239 RepID=UPI00367967FC